ncbi:cationic trypsin-3-like [Brachionichthys hirsutus]|uniref:cationic trypsin-3-like n=1 Tax=Brachionichthys hirsutus TaxID=412623 RepID=UPI00360516E7
MRFGRATPLAAAQRLEGGGEPPQNLLPSPQSSGPLGVSVGGDPVPVRQKDGAGFRTHNQLNATFNKTQQNHEASSGPGVPAGVRPFTPQRDTESRIIGGHEAWPHSWPWQVSLQFVSMATCGGAVISPLWIISAAHCFRRHNKASFWKVLAGKHNLDNPQEPGQQVVGVAVIVSHHGYDPRTKDNDVSLLKLRQPLVFSRSVGSIQVWKTPPSPSRTCTVTGWGATHENGPRVPRLQEVNVTVLSPDACSRYYGNRMQPSMFCAGKDGGGADACQGDSGGPLSCFTGDRYELAGLVSWGVGCGRARKPGVYTKVQVHAEWMSNVTSEC